MVMVNKQEQESKVMNRKLISLTGLLGLALLVAGCSGSGLGREENENTLHQSVARATKIRPAETEAESTQVVPPTEAVVESAPDLAANNQSNLVPSEIPPFDHELAEGEYRWNQLLPRDGIRPIYENEVRFVPADEAPYSDEELVIGVKINGEARAYAIGPLNRREIVNDTVGGMPILVTW